MFPWEHKASRGASILERAIRGTPDLGKTFRDGVPRVSRDDLVKAVPSAIEYRPPQSITQALYYRVLVGDRELSITVGQTGKEHVVWSIGNV